MFEAVEESTLISISIGIHINSMSMLLAVAPLTSVAASVHEFVYSFTVKASVFPIALVVFSFNPSFKELVGLPESFCKDLVIEHEGAFALSLVVPPLT